MLTSSQFLARGHGSRLFDRELSWIAFNRRLVYEVAESCQPIFGRLIKLAQAASSLDEYFMVRMPLLKGAVQGKEAISLDEDSLGRIQTYLKTLIARQQAHFIFNLKPRLAQEGIFLLNHSDLNDVQKKQCHHRFEEEVAPVLAPLITLPGESTPDFFNLSLNLAVALKIDDQRLLGWVKLPRVLPRFMVLPSTGDRTNWIAVPLEQIIAAQISDLFIDHTVHSCFPFRVTRSTDLGVLDAETANLMDMIQESLQQRQQQGCPVRLEAVHSMPGWMRSHLTKHLNLTSADLYSLSRWPGLSDLRELTRLPRPDLMPQSVRQTLPKELLPQPTPSMLSFVQVTSHPADDLFALVAKRDLLIHFPYHSFADTIEKFVAQAAADESVLSIKMTLYRTAVDAPIVRSLIAAAKAGKQIVVLVELTAPLDEAINIHWAKQLEKAGAHVVYGVVGTRTHTNLILIARDEGDQIRQYAYLATGDYLPDRPQPYEDLGILTSQPDIGADLSRLFNFLTGFSRPVQYSTLMVAPGNLKGKLLDMIEREADHARLGRSGRLIAKLNLLADPEIIEALYQASNAGVEIDLIVRSICRLRPGVPAMSDRIRVVSILGDYVEHSRILYCQNDQRPEAWIGTADWTPRGLNERIEVMVPMQTPDRVDSIHKRLQCLLTDNQNSWELQPNGQYIKRVPSATNPAYSAHKKMAQLAKADS